MFLYRTDKFNILHQIRKGAERIYAADRSDDAADAVIQKRSLQIGCTELRMIPQRSCTGKRIFRINRLQTERTQPTFGKLFFVCTPRFTQNPV